MEAAMTPLSLIDGCLVIDNSSLDLVRACPTMGRFKLVEKRERASTTAKGRGPGKAFHSALEARYRFYGRSAPTDLNSLYRVVVEAYEGVQEVPGDEHLTCTAMQDIVKAYCEGVRFEMGKGGKNGIYVFDGYRDEPWQVLGVEVPFAVRLGAVDDVPVIYIGRSDLVVRTIERQETLIVDHKTGRKWDASKQVHWKMAPGPKGYAYCIPKWIREGIADLPPTIRAAMEAHEGVRLMLADAVVERVHGFMLNSVTIRGTTDLSRCKMPPLEFHREINYYQDEHILDEWLANTLEWCATWLDWCHRGAWPRNEGHCSNHFGHPCPYKDVCLLPPQFRAGALATDEFADVTWSPLNRMTDEEN
jgi:PD-(D/E)XK nuclease superfamily